MDGFWSFENYVGSVHYRLVGQGDWRWLADLVEVDRRWLISHIHLVILSLESLNGRPCRNRRAELNSALIFDFVAISFSSGFFIEVRDGDYSIVIYAIMSTSHPSLE